MIKGNYGLSFQQSIYEVISTRSDVNTLKYIEMAPIFDSGNSMLWNKNMKDNECQV